MTTSSISSHPTRSVLVVEDQTLLRKGLVIALEKLTSYKVIGEASDGEAAISEAQRLRPDIILMDVGLPVTDGIEATWKIKQGLPHTKIVILTSHDDSKDVMAALGSGADAYCMKDCTLDHLKIAIESAVKGEIWIDPVLIDSMIYAGGNPAKSGSKCLTSIGKSTLNLLRSGMSQSKIADQLEIKPEKIGEVIVGIIDRFGEPPTLARRQVPNDTEFDILGEWFAASMESSTSGRMFAGKYLIERQLGSGSFGTVWKAQHLLMERTVALKLLTAGLAGKRDALNSFRNEALAVANLHHPNIVSIFDFGITTEREPFLVMEFVDGSDLGQIIEQQGRLEIPQFVQMFSQICDGLSCAHARKVIHCDIKPTNILVAVDEHGKYFPKLSDFGIARVIDKPKDDPESAKYVRGSPIYMPPEQCAGGFLDERSDVYALGCVMFECLTGTPAIPGATVQETMSNQFLFVPKRVSAFLPDKTVPKELELCILKALEKQPDDRIQTVNEIKKVLERVQLNQAMPAV